MRLFQNTIGRFEKLSDRCICVIMYFTQLVLQLIPVAFMKYPILSDEYATLAEGVFLNNGKNWALTLHAAGFDRYYGYGYAAFTCLAYHFTQDMRVIYLLTLCCNAVLVSFIPLICYRIAGHFLLLPKKEACTAAVLTGMYPAYWVLTKYAINESPLYLLVWVILLLLLEIRETGSLRKQCAYSALTGLLCIYSYTVHGRGLALIATGALVLVIILSAKGHMAKRVPALLCYLLVVLAGYAVHDGILHHLAADLFGKKITELYNTFANYVANFELPPVTPGAVGRVFAAAGGMCFYMVCATYGLFLLFLIVLFRKRREMFRIARASEEEQPELVMYWYILILSVVTVGLTLLSFLLMYMKDRVYSGEFWFYGRYCEVFCGLPVFAGLVLLLRGKDTFRKGDTAAVAVMTGIPSVLMLAYTGPKILSMKRKYISYSMTTGAMPFGGFQAGEDPAYGNFIALVAFTAGLAILVWALVFRNKKKILCVLLAALSVYSSLYSWNRFVYRASSEYYEYSAFLDRYGREEKELGAEYPRVYVLNSKTPRLRIKFALADWDVIYTTDRSEVRENSIVVCDRQTDLGKKFRYIRKVNTGNAGNEQDYVWVYGRELIGQFKNRGYELYNVKK
ncbi:MAG: hypothetical protein LKJ76_00640 [Lachnospiraceae bacterium]|jgi:hypothetical protein|nr:hypothetical protein [Lachnospiraceae bacterium]